MQQLLSHVNPARSSSRRARWAIAVVVLAALVGWSPPAAAHDELVASDPAEAGVVEALPSRAVLTFSGEISEVHKVTVTGPDGSVVNGEPTFTGQEVRQNLWAGPDGAYSLAYDVVSADGHEIRGEIAFEVGSISGPIDSGSPDSEATAQSGSGWWDGGGDVILPVALLLLAGAAALVWRRRRVQRSG